MGSQADISPSVDLDRESLDYIIHHVFLPLRLPESDDTNAGVEKALLQHVHSALTAFQELHVRSGIAGLQGIARCILMVQRMISMNQDGALDAGLLNKKLGEMQTDDVLAILVKKQNAGLLVTRLEDAVYFEAFELLARVEDVTKTEGRLRRLFPGRSAAVSVNHLGDSTFRAPLVDALAKMDSDSAPELLTNYRWEKYMQKIETAHPQLVTEMLMGFIRGVGENASVTDLEPARILKNVREEVMGETLTPWRRSALWLLLRVSMQITMERSARQCPARDIYKEFIIFFLCQTLRQALTLDLPHHTLFTMLSKISRRILKLELSEAPWLRAADEILRETRLVLEKSWASIQDEDGRSLDFSVLESLDFAADTELTLRTLRPHLKDFAVGIPLPSSDKSSEAGDHDPYMTDAQSLPQTQFHTDDEDGQLLVYELADFESWVELHLKDHITIRPDADSAWASNAALDSNRGLRIVDYGNFAQEDRGERISQETNIMPDFGFPVTRELKPDSLHDLQNSPGKANRVNSNTDGDTWFRIVDNSFALKFMEQPGKSSAKTEQPGSPVGLCYRCKMINPLASGFKFCVDLAGLGTTAKTCRLCQMLRRSFKKIGLPPKIGTITIYRDGTNLKVDYNAQPVLRICTESESHDFKDIQVGPRSRSESGTGRGYDFSLLRAWLAKCDGTHSRFGCNNRRHSGARFLPTRILDLERWENEGLVRLHCTKEFDSYEYVAVSHCWGSPSEEEWESVCTHSKNLQKRLHHIAFADLPRTFQDAIFATHRLGKRYLWIDSLCIIQRDQRDWERESALMESVFSSAYCTISATCARSFSDGFLRSRPPADYIRVPNAPEGSGPFWLSETVDNFHADVEEGPVNRRGWVLQERVLSRRTIFFTANQIYFECGAGVRCETMTWLWNPRAALLGDPQFPAAILKHDPADRIAPLQMLFESYTAMDLSIATDRPVAISGLARRLVKGFEGATAYGVLERYIHRSLLWQRTGKTALERIKYPCNRRSIPSWSWMAYDGAIQYLDVPKEGVEWNNFVSFAPARNIIAAGPGANPPCTNELKVGVSALRTAEILKDRWSVTLDDPLAADWEELACVVICRCKTSTGKVELYVLFVKSIFMDGYQRVGAGRIQERHLAAKEPVVGRIV